MLPLYTTLKEWEQCNLTQVLPMTSDKWI